MSETRIAAPFGSWESPISASMIADTTISLGGIFVDGDDIYWLESRPSEAGRVVLVHDSGDQPADVTPEGFSVRTRAHEYGGGAVLVRDGTVYFVNAEDQHIYRQMAGAQPHILSESAGDRFADMVLDRARDRLICVRERHGAKGTENALVAISLVDGTATILDGAHAFVSTPRVSPDGSRLAWLSWDLPDMPWDAATLWVAAFETDGGLDDILQLAGGQSDSVFQPEWRPDGTLVFALDRSGWWNLHVWDGQVVSCLVSRNAEFALPQWVFGMRTYDVLPSGDIVCAYSQNGLWQLAKITGGRMEDIETAYTSISAVCAIGEDVVFLGASATESQVAVRCVTRTGNCSVLKRATGQQIEVADLSVPEPITFDTTEGAQAYAFYYPPKNARFTGLPDELPPLIVRGHGGPTSASSPSLSLAIQYWTNRGFAVLDVNYRGSTGFGRAYREALYGKWGVADVDDMVAGAAYLVAMGQADPARLAIRGGSAGGYTALAALTFRDTFSAGASLYGIGDLMTLAEDTHKFESRYLDRLIGPLPEMEALYRERSPINHVAGLNCPVIFLQGSEDKVVPPNQAEAMVAALDEKNIPVAYVLFEGEGHGFRKGENVCRALEAELAFYGKVFGFIPADPLPDLEIRNL
jgi:dipeptidyl aminopeptidase/acylaminoacyl peptidase